MQQINILMFEETITKKDTFCELLELRLTHELNLKLNLLNRIDDSMLECDLMINHFHLILIDDDLGNNLWGNDIIDRIMNETGNNPDFRSVPIFYYSAGTDVNELKNKTRTYGFIHCCTFDFLIDSVMEYVQKKFILI